MTGSTCTPSSAQRRALLQALGTSSSPVLRCRPTLLSTAGLISWTLSSSLTCAVRLEWFGTSLGHRLVEAGCPRQGQQWRAMQEQDGPPGAIFCRAPTGTWGCTAASGFKTTNTDLLDSDLERHLGKRECDGRHGAVQLGDDLAVQPAVQRHLPEGLRVQEAEWGWVREIVRRDRCSDARVRGPRTSDPSAP